MSCDLIGREFMDIHHATYYGIHGFVVPVLDPDSTPIPDLMWDHQVPKDVSIGGDTLDMDTGSTDTSPLFEMKDINVAEIVNMSTAPEKVFRRTKRLSFANTEGKGFDTRTLGGVDDVASFMPTDHFTALLGRPIRTKVPSYLLIAISCPDTNDSTATWPQIDSEADWFQYRYMQDTIVDAMKKISGVGDYDGDMDNALNRVADLLEWFHEGNGLSWTQPGFDVFSEFTIDITVPGEFAVGTLSGQN